jgi:hypothetical protein
MHTQNIVTRYQSMYVSADNFAYTCTFVSFTMSYSSSLIPNSSGAAVDHTNGEKNHIDRMSNEFHSIQLEAIGELSSDGKHIRRENETKPTSLTNRMYHSG